QNLDRLSRMYRKYLQCTSPNFEGWANYGSICCACCLILYKSRGTCTHIAHRPGITTTLLSHSSG
ncbi:hypothetical protein ALC56_14477, partial [Trachymyrmex septentrionalis]